MAQCQGYKIGPSGLRRCARFAEDYGAIGMPAKRGKKGGLRGMRNPTIADVEIQKLAMDGAIGGIGGMVVKNLLESLDFYGALTPSMKTLADFGIGVLFGYVVGKLLKQPGIGYPVAIGISSIAATNLISGFTSPVSGLGLYEAIQRRALPAARPIGVPSGISVKTGY